MDNVMSKGLLLEQLRENRKDHRDFFLEALEGYRKQMLELLEESIEQIKHGDLIERYLGLPVPADHTKDYDRIISMLESDVRDEIALKEQEYAQYVLDDWDWKEQWVASNTAYTSR